MKDLPADRILHWLRDQEDNFVDFLQQLVEMESPSTDIGTHKAPRQQLTDALESLNFHCHRISGRGSGGHLFARPEERLRHQPRQLLLGHYDTVWPLGTLQKMPWSRQANILRGPGVFDMKAGLTQIIFALRALNRFELTPAVTPVIFLNSDEEIGSPDSTRNIHRLARKVNRAYVLEPALGGDGRLKTARKGVGRFHITAYGKSAHAGLDPDSGVSAIHAMADLIQKLFAMNNPETGTTVNVGQVTGGTLANVIAGQCEIEIDVRVTSLIEGKKVTQAIHALRPNHPAIRIVVEGSIRRQPLEANAENQNLWRQAQRLGRRLNLDLQQGLAGGGSDGNITSLYIPTLDGLGAVGDGAHAAHEWVNLERTLERTALLALLLLLPSDC